MELAEGALLASCVGTGMDCTEEGRRCSPGMRWEHRGRGDAGQAVVEATWATVAGRESRGLVRGMNSFFTSECYTCAGLHLPRAEDSRWQQVGAKF